MGTFFMRQFSTITFSLALLVTLFYVAASPCVAQTDVSSPQSWKEEQLDAASFASDWLTDLDNGEFMLAAELTVDGDVQGFAEYIQGIRERMGKMRSRSYHGTMVTAVANDDSEQQIMVEYATEFEAMSVTELVLVLNWQGKCKVISYMVEEARDKQAGLKSSSGVQGGAVDEADNVIDGLFELEHHKNLGDIFK